MWSFFPILETEPFRYSKWFTAKTAILRRRWWRQLSIKIELKFFCTRGMWSLSSGMRAPFRVIATFFHFLFILFSSCSSNTSFLRKYFNYIKKAATQLRVGSDEIELVFLCLLYFNLSTRPSPSRVRCRDYVPCTSATSSSFQLQAADLFQQSEYLKSNRSQIVSTQYRSIDLSPNRDELSWRLAVFFDRSVGPLSRASIIEAVNLIFRWRVTVKVCTSLLSVVCKLSASPIE